MNVPEQLQPAVPCRILSLDGGGAKGLYTLGVLKEIESMVGRPLAGQFDLIFGTSTGSIIAALLALGEPVDDITKHYREHVPAIMRRWTAARRSLALRDAAAKVFGDLTFSAFKTGVGIVATRWAFETPMIFKNSVTQAHGRHATFQPGFGCTIADAVRASCSAYPFFAKTTLDTPDGHVVAIDGGYCANNPTLYAIADAVTRLHRSHSDLRVVSIGVGCYPEAKRWPYWLLRHWPGVPLLQKTMGVNTSSMEQLRAVLFKDIPTVRVNETFSHPEMATDLMESDQRKLNLLYQRGGQSFAAHESALRHLLEISGSAEGGS